MRIVKKINVALAAIIGVSAILNFAALELTVMPSFLDLESEAARRNQSRAIEAIGAQKAQVAASARDYAFWDDSHAFMNGDESDYEEKNVNAESLKALSVNYFLAVDASGAVKLDKGFDYSGEEAQEVRLLPQSALPADHPFRQPFAGPTSRTGLVQTDLGFVAVGYAPVLTTERTGGGSGTLLFGKLLDLDALRDMTKVDFNLLPVAADTPLGQEVIRSPEAIEMRTVLTGLDGKPLALMTSVTSRTITSVGRNAVWAAVGLLAVGGILLIVTLGFVLRRIAVRRIEAMRQHLVGVASTGNLEPIPTDNHSDELSETIASFNAMASQLADLREKLRRQDYHHGAADQAAGILHNVRNAVSPIGTIAWDLTRAEEAPWKQNVSKGLKELMDPELAPDRAKKLTQFVVMSARRLMAEGEKRSADLQSLEAMVRHIDRILKDTDAASQGERVTETIGVAAMVHDVSRLVARRPAVTLHDDLSPEAAVFGHRITLDQVLGNLLVNAAEAIEASERARGTITITSSLVRHDDGPALDIVVRDDGDGIPADCLQAVFEKGYSTRRERSGGFGLHWCANAVNAMGGRMYAESQGRQQGAAIHVILPQAGTELRNAA
jgi:sensor domain CHASE-containing protein